MDGALLNLSASELLQKFGAGEHKPGSGSAAAFQGMLSAQLIRTVISLTCDAKRRSQYGESVTRLQEINSIIETQIYPSLERLFQADSDQFDRVIKLREAREAESDALEKSKLALRAMEALKPATEMPIEIGTLCLELAEFSLQVFECGFKSAKGDSGVALSGALSVVWGCLSIVDLNLLSFGSDDWTEKVRSDAADLREESRRVSTLATAALQGLEAEANQKNDFAIEINAIRSLGGVQRHLSNTEIEKLARKLQAVIWRNRNLIWKHKVPDDLVEVLKPKVALKELGYSYSKAVSLGLHEVEGGVLEVAGLIDNQEKCVMVSEQFSIEVQNFTAAHELGHAMMHDQPVLHRDRPLDGSAISGNRSRDEYQADKFASYYLMPRKLVQTRFREIFLAEKFIVTEETALALNARSSEALRANCRNLRQLSKLLASTEYFNGASINSISTQFGVSVEAMAIRLEELGLVEY